ncbi:MAG: hypothetical protein ACUVTD_00645 [Nitrososphaerales archaeon]
MLEDGEGKRFVEGYISCIISLIAMLSVALTAVKIGRRDLMTSISEFRF